MNVFDGDPERLAWKYGRGYSTVLVVAKIGVGLVEKTAVSGMSHPSDQEVQRLMDRAKEMSEEGTTFVVMRTFFRGMEKARPLPFAEFHNKELIAYCRPPWLVGQRLS
jgi:fructose-bisphosphate aldolase class 1